MTTSTLAMPLRDRMLRASRFASKGLMLISSQAVNLGCLIFVQALIKRTDGLETLGLYSLLVTLFTLLALVFEMGWGPSVAREIACAGDRNLERKLVGALARAVVRPLILQVPAAILLVVGAAYFVSVDLLLPGVVAALFGMGFSLQVTLKDLTVGQGDVQAQSLLTALPPLFQFILFAGLALLGWGGLAAAFWTCAGTFTLYCVLLLTIEGAFAVPDRATMERLTKARIDYGRGIWLGRLFGTGAFILSTPLLGLFADPKGIAYFTIARTLCNPLGVALGYLTQPLFKEFANRPSIPRSYQVALWALTLVGMVATLVVSPVLALVLFEVQPADIVGMLLLQTWASGALGLYAVYTQFLAAQGRGKTLCHLGQLFCVVSLVGNLTLVPWLGALGACWVNALANTFWLVFCIRESALLGRAPAPAAQTKEPAGSSVASVHGRAVECQETLQ